MRNRSIAVRSTERLQPISEGRAPFPPGIHEECIAGIRSQAGHASGYDHKGWQVLLSFRRKVEGAWVSIARHANSHLPQAREPA